MFLIADSGSTKTDWYLAGDHRSPKHFRTIGLNPYFVRGEHMGFVLRRDLPSSFDVSGIQSVFFYGSGCASAENNAIVATALRTVFPKNANITVETDLLGAARALFGHSRGIAAILGTGSNSCLYDGEKITENQFSSGYIFGDEGSGAQLGKTLIALYLKQRIPPEISEAFHDTHKLSREDILAQVYRHEHPNRFLASFSVFIKDQLEHPFVRQLAKDCFRSFIQEQILHYSSCREVPFGCVGSIGYHFRELIREAATEEGIHTGYFEQSPMKGLLAYHSGKVSPG